MKLPYYSLALGTSSLVLLVAGCSRESNRDSYSATETNNTAVVMQNTNAASMSNDTNGVNRDVNNSGINERDRDGNTLTPGDQGNTAEDRDLTQKIRKSLVMDTNYSTTAKNVKIITMNGKVTLRGPVNSDAEKSGVESIAKNIAGDGNVDNQLEVKSNP